MTTNRSTNDMWKATCLAFDVSQFMYRATHEKRAREETEPQPQFDPRAMQREMQASVSGEHGQALRTQHKSPKSGQHQQKWLTYPDLNSDNISTWKFPQSYDRRDLSNLLRDVWNSDFNEAEFKIKKKSYLQKNWFRILFNYVVETGKLWKRTRSSVDNHAKSFIRDKLGNRLWGQDDPTKLLYVEVIWFQAKAIHTMRQDEEIRSLPRHIRSQYEDYFIEFSSRRLLTRNDGFIHMKNIIEKLITSDSVIKLMEDESGPLLLTEGNQTEGNQTEGNQTEGYQTEGNQTEGNQTAIAELDIEDLLNLLE